MKEQVKKAGCIQRGENDGLWGLKFIKKGMEAQEMVQGLRALAVPPQDPSLVSKPHTGRLRSTCNSSSRGSSCSLQTGMDTYTHVHKSTYRYKKGMKKTLQISPM